MRRTALAALFALLTALALTTTWLYSSDGMQGGMPGGVLGVGLLLGCAVVPVVGLTMRMAWALPSAIVLGSVWDLAGIAWGVMLGRSVPADGPPMLAGLESWTLMALLTIPPTLILWLLVPLQRRLVRRLLRRWKHRGEAGVASPSGRYASSPSSDGPAAGGRRPFPAVVDQ